VIEPPHNQRDLIEAALALPPGQRAAWLDAHCRDPAQRHAIERLLSADTDEDVLDRSFDDLLGRVGECEPESPAPPPGSAIGAFTLIEKLGEGGSSIVYRAEREQAGVRQTVALKLLRRGLYSADEQRRFRSERLALAQLRHPGIAHLIEGGVTDAGVPYIALEFVDGAPITDYVREHRTGLRQRLQLFIAVCRAVEAAHRALIVHRDLKPSNVLVSADGEVKLLDFGIAKLLGGDGEDDGLRTQTTAMTPAYAAPEQFSRGLVTTATDVYALGILLGELVTGRRREHGDTRTPSSQVSAANDVDAPPLPARALRKQLRGDLDNIVVKAIDGEPERRYASAGALADDVERHLDGLPVAIAAASPPHSLFCSRFLPPLAWRCGRRMSRATKRNARPACATSCCACSARRNRQVRAWHRRRWSMSCACRSPMRSARRRCIRPCASNCSIPSAVCSARRATSRVASSCSPPTTTMRSRCLVRRVRRPCWQDWHWPAP
jgi:serine/threonine-protein kinase